DFPSVGNVVERMRDAFLGERENCDMLRADVSLSQREAFDGLVVPLSVPVRITCPHCGGRGETWTETCHLCRGTGHAICQHSVRDRKSTRLNSSHRTISYAVFCLKKKKKLAGPGSAGAHSARSQHLLGTGPV